jgi:hypothetical protein
METRSHTPSDDANGLVFDEWSSPGSFDLLSNEQTTSVWRPAHLLGLARGARTTRVVTPAIEMQMTWDDDESTTRMWSHAHFGGPGFAAPRMDSTQRYPARVPTERIGRTTQAQVIAATRTAPPPPPPPIARHTAGQRVARQAPPPPPPPSRRAVPLPAARQTAPHLAPVQPSALTTGPRPAARTTQPNRPLALVPAIATVTHTTEDLGVETDSQALHWLWTLASGVGLFVAVLAGVVLLPIGRPSVAVTTTSPVNLLAAANVAHDTASTEQTQVTPDRESNAQQAAVPAPAMKPQRQARRSAAREPSNTDLLAATPNANSAVGAAPLPEPALSDADETAPSSAATRHQEAAAAHTAARNQEPGLLRINSRPWAQVFVDGKPRGTTPQMGLAVNPGHHTVQLVNTPMGMSKTFPLDIQAGEIVTKVVNLIE